MEPKNRVLLRLEAIVASDPVLDPMTIAMSIMLEIGDVIQPPRH
jgi:hypothetical protein